MKETDASSDPQRMAAATPMPQGGLPPPEDGPADPQERQIAAIYRAVIRSLHRTDHASGEDLLSPRLFLLYALADSAESAHPRRPDRTLASGPMREWILQGVSDLPVWIVWIEHPSGAAPQDAGNGLAGAGTMVVFHGIRHDGPGLAVVAGSLFRPHRSALGLEYIVEKRNGSWTVKSSYRKCLR
jgi:hypothetical protein